MTNGGVKTLAKSEQKMTPVTVTRGSKPEILSQRVDWIAGTFRGRKTHELALNLTQNYEQCKGYLNYSEGSLFEDGRKLFVSPSHPEWGVHMVWSGTACANCPVDPIHLICALICAGFNFTRIDFAVDAKNFNLRPSQATEEIKSERIKTRAKECPAWFDVAGKGYTQYVGKKSSEIYMRIYDKAAEMGINADHTRVELVVRSERADKAARQAVLRRDFRGMVVSFADFPQWNEWNKAMATTPIKLPSERQETATRKWLIEQCVPALAREILKSDGVDFYEKFKDALMSKAEQLSNDRQTVQ
jgi:hypothetical protein